MSIFGSNDRQNTTEAATKSYSDLILPAVTNANNNRVLQVQSGKWGVSAINGVQITDVYAI